MVRFKCKKCGKVWYTANTSSDQRCDDCGGLLEDTDIFEQNEDVEGSSNS